MLNVSLELWAPTLASAAALVVSIVGCVPYALILSDWRCAVFGRSSVDVMNGITVHYAILALGACLLAFGTLELLRQPPAAVLAAFIAVVSVLGVATWRVRTHVLRTLAARRPFF